MSYKTRRLFEEQLSSFENETQENHVENEEKIVLQYDWQGWPVNAMKLKDILKELGFIDNGEKIFLPHTEENDKLLNAYPRLLKDDGMGYGVDEEYICTAENDVFEETIGENKVNVFNLFREKFVEP